MHYLFDGSFDGLMTVVFDTYRLSPRIQTLSVYTGADSLLPTEYISRDPDKAARIKHYLVKHMGPHFLKMVQTAFLSRREGRFAAIVRTLQRAIEQGPSVLSLVDKDARLFYVCHREVEREAHRFTGLLRMRVMRDGTLLAVFEPVHDILTLLLPHFLDRYPDERLLLYDEGRKLAGMAAGGQVTFMQVDYLEPDDLEGEQYMQRLWRTFYDALAIPGRINPKLRQQHMPKYTWENLPEMRGEG